MIRPDEIPLQTIRDLSVVAVVEIFADVTISLMLIILFIKKLMKVALATFDKEELMESHRKSLHLKESFSDDIQVTSTQYRLLNIITKQTILAVIGTITHKYGYFIMYLWL